MVYVLWDVTSLVVLLECLRLWKEFGLIGLMGVELELESELWKKIESVLLLDFLQRLLEQGKGNKLGRKVLV